MPSSRRASTFRDLALVVVDEQHRFGVHQRLALTAKGGATDVLVMTATPIPRTLVLTYYGDMDVSRLTEKPAGRKPIDTRVVPLDRLDEVVERIRAAIGRRRQGLLGLPAGRGIGDARRCRRRRGAPRSAEGGPRPGRRPRPRPHEGGASATRVMAASRPARLQGAGRDHRGRGRRRRPRRDHHGHRARRALRPRPAPPAARPGRTKRQAVDLPPALSRRRSAPSPASGWRSCARPRTASSSPRRTCGCAAAARSSARASRACPASASPAPSTTPI